jgi:plasmid stabilization system protein ParE
MTIRWTQPANDDFIGIVEWIAVNNRGAASAVGRKILAAVEQLDDFSFLGRPGRSPDTRELVIASLPYLAVYCIESAPPRSVVILRVLHGAMLWPPDAGAPPTRDDGST